MSIQPAGKLKSEGVRRLICRQLPRILLLSALLAFSLSAFVIVQDQAAVVGTTGTYQYLISGFDFRANQPCLNNPALKCSGSVSLKIRVSRSEEARISPQSSKPAALHSWAVWSNGD